MGGTRSAARQGGEDRLQGGDHPGRRRLGRRPLAQRHRGLRVAAALEARARRDQDPHGARVRLHARRVQARLALGMPARSLRAHLLRMLLPPIAALLALGAIVAYYPSGEPTTEAYDQALVDIGIALGGHIRVAPDEYRFEVPPAVEQVLRTDRYDVIFYRVLSPSGQHIAGDTSLRPPSGDVTAYNSDVNGQKVRVVSVEAPCGRSSCTILVGE